MKKKWCGYSKYKNIGESSGWWSCSGKGQEVGDSQAVGPQVKIEEMSKTVGIIRVQ